MKPVRAVEVDCPECGEGVADIAPNVVINPTPHPDALAPGVNYVRAAGTCWNGHVLLLKVDEPGGAVEVEARGHATGPTPLERVAAAQALGAIECHDLPAVRALAEPITKAMPRFARLQAFRLARLDFVASRDATTGHQKEGS